MTIVFLVVIIIAAVLLGFIVLIQNPKGGGLAGNVAGFSNQFMGVKQTTDVLEKGTWILAGIIGLLCIVSVLFLKPSAPVNPLKNIPTQQNTSPTAPTNGAVAPTTPDSTK